MSKSVLCTILLGLLINLAYALDCSSPDLTTKQKRRCKTMERAQKFGAADEPAADEGSTPKKKKKTAKAGACADQYEDWKKQRQTCLKALRTATAPDKQPQSGIFVPNLNAYVPCTNEEMQNFPDFVGSKGKCKDFEMEEMETAFGKAFDVCIENFDASECAALFEKKKPDAITTTSGVTLSMVAAQRGNDEAFKLLQSKGADLGAFDLDGNSVLKFALSLKYPSGQGQNAEFKKLEASQKIIVQAILDAGVSPKELDGQFLSVLNVALNSGAPVSVLKMLADGGAKFTVSLKRDGKITLSTLADRVKQGDVAGVKKILAAGANPNEVAEEPFTLWGIVWGVEGRPVEVGDSLAVALLEGGLDPNGFLDVNHKTSIYVDALIAHSPEWVMKAFYAAGLDASKLIWKGKPFDAMVSAIEFDNVELAKYILKKSYDVKSIVFSTNSGMELTALEYALIRNKPSLVKFFVANRFNVNRDIPEYEGSSEIHHPVCLAVSIDTTEVSLKALMSGKMKVNVNASCGQLFPLQIAVSNSNVGQVKQLISAKADVNANFYLASDQITSITALEYAEIIGNETIIALLKKAGAKKPFRGNFVQFCLDSSVTDKMILDAIKEGADVNEVDPEQGWTPLHAVAQNGKNPKALQVLIQKGAFVNAMTKNGYTPLLSAATYNRNPAFVKMLIAAGADVDAREENNNWGPLEKAVAFNTPEVVSVLFSAGLDNDYSESDKVTLVKIAVRNNDNERVLIMLLKRGYKTQNSDYDYDTPLSIAIEDQRKIDIIKVLISGGAYVSDHIMSKAKDLPVGTYRNKVIDILTKAKKKQGR